MNKTPISWLQELMAQKKLTAPVYIEEGQATDFKCTVRASDVIGFGKGSNKKEAKHNSAKDALEKLGFRNLTQTSLPAAPPTRNILYANYVGILNEKCTGAFPVYETDWYPPDFLCKCRYLGKESLGKALNKKDAKQEAAKNMLSLINIGDLLVNQTPKIKLCLEVDGDAKRVIDNFNKLSLGNQGLRQPKTEVTVPRVLNVNIDASQSLEELRGEVKRHGVEYKVVAFQKNPVGLYLQIKDSICTLLQVDKTKEEAERKLLLDLLNMMTTGCDLTDDLIKF